MSGLIRPQSESSTETLRTFVCVEIPRIIQERIGELQKRLPKGKAQVSWVKPSNIHLTLKFLGEVPKRQVSSISAALKRAARSAGPFVVEVRGTGCFPSRENPRVLWVGMSATPEVLRQLHAAIEDRLATEGFGREKREFTPHLTIGRLRSPRGARPLIDALLTTSFESTAFQAREILLMCSVLNPAGAIYTPLATFPLGIEA